MDSSERKGRRQAAKVSPVPYLLEAYDMCRTDDTARGEENENIPALNGRLTGG